MMCTCTCVMMLLLFEMRLPHLINDDYGDGDVMIIFTCTIVAAGAMVTVAEVTVVAVTAMGYVCKSKCQSCRLVLVLLPVD